ncbi:interleukin-1 receptor antagonist protein-like [Lepidochelys kempii]|uniref:interleukin-1 receptor antagonist protein-like n=2 Tax=Cheloniidae TaxID=8465 RepID=UPI003C703AE7
MARVPDPLTELIGCDSYHHEVDCPCRMKNRSLSELGSHWKAIDQVDSVAFRWAAEVPQEETRRRMNRLARSFTDIDFMRMLVEDPVSFSNNSFTHAETFIYKYTRSKLYAVQDEEHKSFVLRRHGSQAQLMAVHLQGPNISKAVKLNLDLYRSPHISPKRISPVAMNIVESNTVENNLYLCCVKAEGSPVLQLEKVKGPMKEIRTGDQERFLFFKTSSGSTSSFESAAHPGWFLSTSKLNDKPVRMVNQTGERDITDLYLVEI